MRFTCFATITAALCLSVSAKFSSSALADKFKTVSESISIDIDGWTEELLDNVKEKIQEKLDQINDMDANTVMKALHLESDSNGEIGVRNVTCISTWCGSKLAACSLD